MDRRARWHHLLVNFLLLGAFDQALGFSLNRPVTSVRPGPSTLPVSASSSSLSSSSSLPPLPLTRGQMQRLKRMGARLGASTAGVPEAVDEPNAPDSPDLPEELVAESATFRRIALMLYRWSGASWWVQVVLATVSGVTLFFANAVTDRTSVGAGALSNGLLFSSGGLILAFASIIWTWGYRRLAAKIRDRLVDSTSLPTRIRKKLRVGCAINLLGMFLTLISAEQIVGLLIARVLSIQGVQSTLSSGALAQYGLASQAIRPLDIFIVQANTNTLVAHFAGLVTALWLQTRIS